MKLQSLYKLLIIALATVFISCNDTLQKVGFSIQPGNDKVSVGTDTLELSSRTVQVDSIFSRTKFPILGEYTDPVFGKIRSEYVGEFFYPENYAFKEGAKIDSVRLTISYNSIIGDSLVPMRLAVYKVTKELPKNKNYTNFNPEGNADMSAPLGTQNFTGRNKTYHTETYYEGGSYRTIKVYDIHTNLPKSIGEDFLAEYKKPGHGALKDADSFKKFFPGVYVTTDFGNSAILNVNLTSLRVFYNYLDKGGSSTKKDTIRSSEFRLNITPEVTQINYLENKNDQLLQPNPKGSFVKSPAGVNTEITFPISKIYNNLTKRALNQAKFVVHALPEPQQNEFVKLSAPRHLLLINKDSLSGFFENRKLPDNITSFVTTFSSETYTYNFGNISAMINHYNKEKTEPFDLKYYLIPVDVTFQADQSGRPTGTPIAVYNQMMPAGAMINGDPKKLRLEMIYSTFE